MVAKGELLHPVQWNRSNWEVFIVLQSWTTDKTNKIFCPDISICEIFTMNRTNRIVSNIDKYQIFRHACLQSRFHKISPFSGQNNWVYRGDPPNIFFIGILIFLLLRSPCKIFPKCFSPLESYYFCELRVHAKF